MRTTCLLADADSRLCGPVRCNRHLGYWTCPRCNRRWYARVPQHSRTPTTRCSTGLCQRWRARPSATELGEQWVQSHFEEIDSVAALRALPAADLLKAQESGYNVTVTVDGAFMPDHAANIFARGEQMDVPVIAGTNTDEDTIFFGIQPFNTVDAYAQSPCRHGPGLFASVAIPFQPPLSGRARVGRLPRHGNRLCLRQPSPHFSPGRFSASKELMVSRS